MVQDKKFNQQPSKNQQMPERKPDRAKEEFHGSKTTRPEIDLPLKGGRAESDLSKNQPKKDERSSFNKPLRK